MMLQKKWIILAIIVLTAAVFGLLYARPVMLQHMTSSVSLSDCISFKGGQGVFKLPSADGQFPRMLSQLEGRKFRKSLADFLPRTAAAQAVSARASSLLRGLQQRALSAAGTSENTASVLLSRGRFAGKYAGIFALSGSVAPCRASGASHVLYAAPAESLLKTA